MVHGTCPWAGDRQIRSVLMLHDGGEKMLWHVECSQEWRTWKPREPGETLRSGFWAPGVNSGHLDAVFDFKYCYKCAREQKERKNPTS